VEPHLASPRKQWFADYSHFNDRGAGLVAGLAADAISARLTGAIPAGKEVPCATP
jgi:hypothetical protein